MHILLSLDSVYTPQYLAVATFSLCSTTGKTNIRMDLRETGWDGMDWMDLAQDRDQWRALVNTVMNLRVP
jgi:hypothetical protein